MASLYSIGKRQNGKAALNQTGNTAIN